MQTAQNDEQARQRFGEGSRAHEVRHVGTLQYHGGENCLTAPDHLPCCYRGLSMGDMEHGPQPSRPLTCSYNFPYKEKAVAACLILAGSESLCTRQFVYHTLREGDRFSIDMLFKSC